MYRFFKVSPFVMSRYVFRSPWISSFRLTCGRAHVIGSENVLGEEKDYDHEEDLNGQKG